MSLHSVIWLEPNCFVKATHASKILYKLYVKLLLVTVTMSVAAGRRFSLALTDVGDLYAFGLNDVGQLVQHTDTVNDERQHVMPLLVDRRHFLADQQVEMVSTGSEHAACVTTDGLVYTWGCTDYGQMGIGDEENDSADEPYVSHCLSTACFGNCRARMVACGENFTVVLTVQGLVWTCGFGGNGQLGRGTIDLQANIDNCSRVLRQIDTASFHHIPVDFIAAGGNHAMALEEGTGVLWAWGGNMSGELGLGDDFHGVEVVDVPTRVPIAPVVFMSAGYDFSMAITTGNVLWSCGEGFGGQLGLSPQLVVANYNTFMRVGGVEKFGIGGVRMVSCGFESSLIVTCSDRVWTCGSHVRFDNTGINVQDGAHLYTPRRFGADYFGRSRIVVASDGRKHHMVVTDAGRMYTWGRDTSEGEATGLGYNTNGTSRWRPSELMNSHYFASNRVGRWHRVSAVRAQSFAMATHPRLGDGSPAQDFPQGPMQDMMSTMGPHAHRGALGRLLGRKTRR